MATTTAPNTLPVSVPQGNGFAVGALVLGLVSLITCWMPFVGGSLGATGLVLGVAGLMRSKRTSSGKGLSIAGLVLSILGTAAAVGFYLLITAVAKSLAS